MISQRHEGEHVTTGKHNLHFLCGSWSLSGEGGRTDKPADSFDKIKKPTTRMNV